MKKHKKISGNTLTTFSGYFLILGVTIFWGVAWPVMKVALNEIPPWTFRTISLVCGGAGLMVLAKAKGYSVAVPRGQWLPLMIVSLFNITGWHLGSAHGISLMMAGRAAILGFTMPLWATIIGYFVLGEKINLHKIFALLLGMAGLIILLGPQIYTLEKAPFGALCMVFAAVCWATGTVLLKYFSWSIPILVLTGWQLTLGSIPVVVGTLLLEPMLHPSQLSVNALLATAYVVAIPIIFCHWAWYNVVSIFPASVAAISILAVPTIGVLSSTLFLGEQVGVFDIIALFLVTSAVGIILLWRR